MLTFTRCERTRQIETPLGLQSPKIMNMQTPEDTALNEIPQTATDTEAIDVDTEATPTASATPTVSATPTLATPSTGTAYPSSSCTMGTFASVENGFFFPASAYRRDHVRPPDYYSADLGRFTQLLRSQRQQQQRSQRNKPTLVHNNSSSSSSGECMITKPNVHINNNNSSSSESEDSSSDSDHDDVLPAAMLPKGGKGAPNQYMEKGVQYANDEYMEKGVEYANDEYMEKGVQYANDQYMENEVQYSNDQYIENEDEHDGSEAGSNEKMEEEEAVPEPSYHQYVDTPPDIQYQRDIVTVTNISGDS